MDEKTKGLYERALAEWGEPLQIVMLIEEMAELVAALTHRLRGQKNHKKLAEELADVEIMIEQFRIVIEKEREDEEISFDHLVKHFRNDKLYRLAERIEKGGC